MMDNPKQPEIDRDNLETAGFSSESESDSSIEQLMQPEVASESAKEVDAAQSEANLEQTNTIVILQEEITELKQQLQEQIQQAESHKLQYVRIAADFDNFRKRTLREKESLEQQVKRSTLSELLSIVDNFERARTQIKPSSEGEMAIHKSYQGVYKNLVDSLKRLGVSAMRPEGQPFDPKYHEAMLQEPTTEYPEGTVIEQLVRGYLLGEQVLRHAMVKVAAPVETDMTSEDSLLNPNETQVE